MPPSLTKTNDSRALFDQFLRELDAANDQTQKLFHVVREGEINFASHKTELRILAEDLREIAGIVRGDDGDLSLMTRIVILEKTLERMEKSHERFEKGIEERFKEIKDALKSKSNEENVDRKTMVDAHIVESKIKWQTYAGFGAGVLALLGTVVTILSNYLSK